MLVKMYYLDGVLFGEVALGELAGVGTGIVNLYVTVAGFVLDIAVGFGSDAAGDLSGVVGFSSSEVIGPLPGFRSVTDEYGCKLRMGLVLLGLL